MGKLGKRIFNATRAVLCLYAVKPYFIPTTGKNVDSYTWPC